jgi:hypothetical protein
MIGGTNVTSIKPRELYFVDEDTLVLFASETAERFSSRYNFERSAALVLDLKSGKVRQLLIGIVGLMPDRESLVVRAFEKGSEFSSLYRMRLSGGKRDGPIFSRDNASVARPLVGIDRVVYGVEYSGFFPEYEFLDSQLTTWVKSIQSALEGTAVHIADWTPAFKNVLIRVSGGWNSGTYVLVGRGAPEPILIANQRPAILPELISETTTFSYEARDGLSIPALLTGRSDVRKSGKAPLIRRRRHCVKYLRSSLLTISRHLYYSFMARTIPLCQCRRASACTMRSSVRKKTFPLFDLMAKTTTCRNALRASKHCVL